MERREFKIGRAGIFKRFFLNPWHCKDKARKLDGKGVVSKSRRQKDVVDAAESRTR